MNSNSILQPTYDTLQLHSVYVFRGLYHAHKQYDQINTRDILADIGCIAIHASHNTPATHVVGAELHEVLTVHIVCESVTASVKDEVTRVYAKELWLGRVRAVGHPPRR